MIVLIADDQDHYRSLLRGLLEPEGYRIVEARDGKEALARIQEAKTPVVALIDWEMPGMKGPDVCRVASGRGGGPPLFLILMAVGDDQTDVVAGLQAGANDYVTKPIRPAELVARVRNAAHTVGLQRALQDRLEELKIALARVQELDGLLPICGYCKKIRNDQDYWQQVEDYISFHSRAKFTHSICPQCYEAKVKPELDQLVADSKAEAMDAHSSDSGEDDGARPAHWYQ